MMRDKCALNIWEAECAIISGANVRRTGKEDGFEIDDSEREVDLKSWDLWSTGCGDLISGSRACHEPM